MSEWNRNISMRALRSFCAAAHRLSFRQAAEDLFITASAVSHQIKHLEQELGMPLFQRLPRSLELTKAGEQLADDLLPVLERLDEILAHRPGNTPPSEVSLSVRPLFANELLMPRLGEFLEAHPDFRIRVETSEDVASDDPTSDASIRLFLKPPTTGDWDKLFSVSHVPVGTLKLYQQISVVGGRIRAPFPIIIHDRRPRIWQDWQKASGLTLHRDCPVIKVNSSLAVARAAEKGLGAALLPTHLCASSIQNGSMVALFDKELTSGEAFYFGSYQSLRSDSPFSEFRRWVLKQFATCA